MQEKKRVVFLYAVPYSGHYHASQSVREVLDDNSIETFSIDMIQVYPYWSKLIISFYWLIAKRIPWLLDKVWDNLVIEKNTRKIRQIMLSLISKKLRKICEKLQPDFIVCTHAFPCSIVSYEKEKNNWAIPLAAIITDYGIHPYWFSPVVDRYFVSSEEIKNKLLSWKIKESKIKVSGIPIKSVFKQRLAKELARELLGLEPELPTLLFMGGSHGLLSTNLVIKNLINFPKPVQAIILDGINGTTKRRVIKTGNSKVHVVGYGNGVPLMMDAADVLISKPGGLTISEAMAKKIPLIIFNPLPAQERENTQFLLENNAALRAYNITELKNMIIELLSNPDKSNNLKEKISFLYKNDATKIVAEEIKTMVC